MLGTVVAHDLVNLIAQSGGAEHDEFLQLLAKHYAPDARRVTRACERWRADPSPANLAALSTAVEAPRQELFRRMNMAPDGTATLVTLRASFCSRPLADPRPLRRVDADLLHLFGSWFNRGFLELERIDWHTPAAILEKLIAYEAVHAIDGWDDLRRRLAADRRCFAFFHPALPDEPLIFVEVALVEDASPIRSSRSCARRSIGEAAERRYGDLLFDLQLPAGAARRLLRQFPHQAGGRRT